MNPLRWFARRWAPGWPGPEGYAYAVILPLVAVTPGCAGSLEAAKPRTVGVSAEPSPRCATLDDRRAFFGAAGKTLAVLGGGAGLATIPATDDRLETGLAIGSMASAALAAGAVYVSEQSGTSWARECSAR